MNSLYPGKADTLTAKNIVDSFQSAYYSVHGNQPQVCEYMGRNCYNINGVVRNRAWVLLEVERLRQEALARAFDTGSNGSDSRGRIFKLIRRLKRF